MPRIAAVAALGRLVAIAMGKVASIGRFVDVAVAAGKVLPEVCSLEMVAFAKASFMCTEVATVVDLLGTAGIVIELVAAVGIGVELVAAAGIGVKLVAAVGS